MSDANLCEWCNGTGEGYTPDTTCQDCKGSGETIRYDEDDPDDENERRAEYARDFDCCMEDNE